MPDTQIKVLLTRGRESLGRYVLKPGAYLVGRDPASDIVVDCADVSQRHARLSVTPDEVRYEDLGSSNGSFVEGERINAAIVLRLPQQVRLGSVVLEIDWAMPSESGDGDVGKKKAVALSREEALRVGEHYRASTLVARGGMGAIHEAEDLHLGRTVAMKRLLSGSRASPDSRQRFLREAEILGRLEHPNIVPVHDLCIDEEGELFYTMKFVKGVTLHQVLDKLKAGDADTIAKFPLANLLTIFQKVCDAVSFAHSKGVIHRDLKPENLMLGDFGEVLVMDWGLAKILGASSSSSSSEFLVSRTRDEDEDEREAADQSLRELPVDKGDDAIHTLEGRIMGSPQFMSPEQAEGRVKDIDARTDIYASGAILYAMLTLRPPVMGRDLATMLESIRKGEIRPPVEHNEVSIGGAKDNRFPQCPGGKIPASLSAVAMKALSVRARDRYESVGTLQQEIAAHQNGFATKAEDAGLLKLATLWIKRHKVAAATALLIVTVIAIASVTVLSMWLELRGTAGTFYDKSQALVATGKFSEALAPIDYAIRLVPKETEYHVLRGNIYESLLKLDAARASYQHALRLDANHKLARENLELCERLQQMSSKAREFPWAALRDLQTAMQTQGRVPEAQAMLQELLAKDAAARKEFYDKWRAKLDQAGVKGTLTVDDAGTVAFEDGGPSVKATVANLAALKGLPLNSLALFNSSVADLSPVKDMPLQRLDLYVSQVADIGTLSGMPLTFLRLQACNLTDLRPLIGMPLEFLNIDNTKVTDLKPLTGMRLKGLEIVDLAVSDLSVLRGMPLESLQVSGTKIGDVRILGELPLKYLSLNRTRVSDLTPLKGMSLTDLKIRETPVADLTPLKGMPLAHLDISSTKVQDLLPLVGLPLGHLSLDDTKVADLTPLVGLPLRVLNAKRILATNFMPLSGMKIDQLTLSGSRIRDLSSLHGMPLEALLLDSCLELRDLSVLAEIKTLQTLTIPAQVKDIEFLRAMPNLKQLGYFDQQRLPVAEFWKAYDARKK